MLQTISLKIIARHTDGAASNKPDITQKLPRVAYTVSNLHYFISSLTVTKNTMGHSELQLT